MPPCASRSRCTRPGRTSSRRRTTTTGRSDAGSDRLTPHRSKEEADDYRYFPEPDLVPIRPEALAAAREDVAAAPAARIRALEGPVGFATAWELVTTGRDGEHDKLVAAGVDARVAANVVRNEAAGVTIAEPAELARVIEARERLPRDVYLEAVAASGTPGFSADSYLEREQVSDEASLEPVIDAVLAAHADQVAAYRAGKEGLLGFFVGQVMKETGGAANPKLVGRHAAPEAAGMSADPVAEANALLVDRGYREPQLAVHVSPMPGRVLLKGTKIVSPFADAPDVVLRVVRERVPDAAELGDRMLTPHELRDWLAEVSSDADRRA